MRLLTHNFLQSNVRGTTEGYPLKIEATKVIIEESTMDSLLARKALNKVNYPALIAAVAALERTSGPESMTSSISLQATNIPSDPPKEGDSIAEATMKAFHFFLFDVHVLEGILICPHSGRKFPIKDGIPNMILHEDEV